MNYRYYKQILADKPMPYAFVDLDMLEANIRHTVERAGNKSIRVASKSVRAIDILRRIFAVDAQYQGVMCFTIPEALFLAEQGFDDLLLGYPVWQPDQIQAVCHAVKAGKTITLMVDSAEHVEHVSRIATAEGVTLPICIDIDLSVDFPRLHFGVWRSGINSVERALWLWAEIQKLKHVELVGVMGYEAQIAGVGDKVAGQVIRNRAIRWLKQRSVPQIVARRTAIVAALRDAGAELRFVNGGGTGSLRTTIQEDAVTEVTVGSGFFASALFDHYQDFQYRPAAGFAIEIVRQPKPNIYTCLGGGYIASGGVGADKQPKPYLPEGAGLTPLEGAGEVQTPIIYDGPEKLRLGDPIFMRHSKAGELCERFNSLYLIQNGSVVNEIPTYRGMGHAFL